jgi:hypothetical protein
VIAGAIGVVCLDRNWILSAAVLSGCSAALCLAGAITDGLMSQFFNKIMSCSIPSDQCPISGACPSFVYQWSAPVGGRYSTASFPGYQSKSATVGGFLDQCTWYHYSRGFVFDELKKLSCISRFDSADLVPTTVTINPVTGAKQSILLLPDSTLSKVCYQINVNRKAGYDITDITENTAPLFAASCAVCVLGLVMSITLSIYASMTYAWHPVRTHKDEAHFGVGAQSTN